ncbi:MAG: acetate--CoA ligase family protein [Rubellimicrobium sp.]|nr:acetate--CoA ligase family protein [Rubellimicrobium sp.]
MSSELRARRRANLRRLLAPRSVALVGGAALAPSVEMLRRAGYGGTIRIVNPVRAEIAGIACVPAVADLPEPPDAAFLAVNRKLTVAAVADLARIGAGGAVCFAAGFGEMGDEGQRLQAELLAVAGDLAVVGPNSNGLLNRLDHLALWPMADHAPDTVARGPAIISQSGGIAYAFVRDRRGLVPAVIASTGNQVILDVADWIAVLGDDPRITAIGLFMEGPGDVQALAEAAEVTRARNLPVVVLKSGRSALGAEMALTHSGALAGDDDLFHALCERLGFIRVATLPQLLETTKALSIWGDRICGNRMAVLTASGAARALFADAAADNGLTLPPVSPEVAARLRPQLPEFAHVSNPLDHNAYYTGMDVLSLENEPAMARCFATMLEDPYDVAVLNGEGGEDEAGTPMLRAWLTAVKESGTPAALVTALPDYLSPAAQRLCREAGIAPLQGLEDGVAAIAAAARHAGFAAREPGPLALLAPPVAGAVRILDEEESKTRLAAAGIPFAARRFVQADGVAAAARALGWPVVLKGVSAKVPHKNRFGAVAVGITDEAALMSALAAMQVRFAEAGITPRGWLVEEMVPDAQAEIIVGVKSSPIYGPALVLGSGGVDVEEARDAAVLLLPADAAAITRAIAGLGISRRLDGDARARVARLALAVADWMRETGDHVTSLDLNPVLVARDGRVVAVDALIETRG